MYGNILDSKKAFLDWKIKELKSPKVSISSKGLVHGPAQFWSKNSIFFRLFTSGTKSKENVFGDILELKNNFLAYKNNNLQKSQNWDFYKGLTPWFS